MPFDLTTLDEPLKTLAAYDWGADAAPFKAIDAAVIAAHADKALRAELEKRFTDLLDLVQADDLLVLNDTRVIKARLHGTKSTGGRLELLVERIVDG